MIKNTTTSTPEAIIQRPHSNTNPTDKHRVIRFADWLDRINGKTTGEIPALAEFDNHDDAQAEADRRNGRGGV